MEERTAYARYVGQSNEIEVPLSSERLAAADARGIRRQFEALYARQFTRDIPGAAVEIINWSVRMRGDVGAQRADPFKASVTTGIRLNAVERRIYEPGDRVWVVAPVRRREDLTEEQPIGGPALIVEKDTTTLVTASFAVSQAQGGCIRLITQSRETA